MIVSVHIPKTAGTSFREDLRGAFGPRLLLDYGDWPEAATAETRTRDERRRAAMLAEAGGYVARYDAIHGHFAARKYLNVFPATTLIAFVRDPYQHAISSYEFARRLPPVEHPAHRAFLERRMSLVDLVEAVPNHQSTYFAGISIENFAMVGLTERYERSLALFEAISGIPMPRRSTLLNANLDKERGDYEVSADVRRAVERYRAEDVKLYHRARDRFAAQCASYGV